MFQPSVFSEMTALAQQHGALNLAQGFPEFGPPEEAVEAYRAALAEGWHQYAPAAGLPALRQALSALDRRRWGSDSPAAADPDSEITVVPGATVGLYAAFLTLIQPGDEAVVLEPAYDSYGPALRRAGGTVVTGSFAAPDWSVLLSTRTRVVVVNSPHNPTGSVWSREDWDRLARALEPFPNAVVVSDEAYEWMVFDNQQPFSVRQVDSLRSRAFRILSLGKTFHATGWKIGAVVAPPSWTAQFRQVYQFLAFAANTPAQKALASALEVRPDYPETLARFFQDKRDRLDRALRAGGWDVQPCAGSYFLTVRLPHGTDDWAWARARAADARVAVVPLQPFYVDATGEPPAVRLCFAKNDSTLDEAAKRLNHWKNQNPL